MLSNLILGFWYTLRSLLANINFAVTSWSPQKLSIVPPYQNLPLPIPRHLPGGLSEQSLPKLEAVLQRFFSLCPSIRLFLFQTWPGVCAQEVHLLQVHQLGMTVPLPTNSQPCTIPATAAQSQLGFTQTFPCSLQFRMPTFDSQQLS